MLSSPLSEVRYSWEREEYLQEGNSIGDAGALTNGPAGETDGPGGAASDPNAYPSILPSLGCYKDTDPFSRPGIRHRMSKAALATLFLFVCSSGPSSGQ